MTKYSNIFNLTNQLREKAVILPSPYVDYINAELDRLNKYAKIKLDMIIGRKEEEK